MLNKLWNKVTRKIYFLTKQKNILQVLTYNPKNFHWLNKKFGPRMFYEWTGKTIKKNPIKIIKNKINVKMPCEQKTTSEKWKFSFKKIGPEWTINGKGKRFKKSDPKKSKNQWNAACAQKTTSEKANFRSNTVFSLCFEIRAKKIQATKPLTFSLQLLFRRDQNHYSKLTSKSWK